MFTTNNNLYNFLYNGPHDVNSTFPVSFTVTIRNINVLKQEEFDTDNKETPIFSKYYG